MGHFKLTLTVLGGYADLVGNRGGMVTRGNTIYIGTDYAIAVTIDDNSVTYDFDRSKRLPADILLHELVHVVQNNTRGEVNDLCGCSLDREREAMTVQGAVLREINRPTIYDRSLLGADMTNGVYTADPWDDARYEQFRRDLRTLYGGVGWYDHYPIR